jgi:orotidine-5'-phosphate decarboxylase
MTAAAGTAADSSALVYPHFADRLHAAIARVGSPACVGLDPVVERLPESLRRGPGNRPIGAADAIEAFCLAVIDAVADSVAIVKPQSACFERYGQSGIGVLRKVIQAARARGMVVILDAKRGDIGATAEHYAAAVFGPAARAGQPERPTFAADAVTLSGYMGMDTIEPFLNHDAGGGAFVLVRTSNPGSDAVQAVKLADGRTVAEMLADHVAELGRRPGNLAACGLSRVGAVVGATKSSEAAALRARMPEQYLLIPGYGAQGGTLEDIKPMLRSNTSAADAGVVVNASRSVLYAFAADQKDWTGAISDAARRLADDLRSLTN